MVRCGCCEGGGVGGEWGREGGGWRGGVLISVELALVCCGVVRGGWLV